MKFTKLTAFFAVFFTLFFVNPVINSAQTVSRNIGELEAGSKIRVQMDNEINSKVSSLNDTFTVTVSEPVVVNEVAVLPVGVVIEGRITKAERADFGGKNGNLEVVFETLTFENGTKRSIEAVLVNKLKAETSNTMKILTILGGTAIGGIIGAVTDTENGALIGAGIGAGAGTGTALLQKGKEVRIKAQEEFEIVLTKSVNLPAEGF